MRVHLAGTHHRKSPIKLLLGYGADIHPNDRYDRTPLHNARGRGSRTIAEWPQLCGATE